MCWSTLFFFGHVRAVCRIHHEQENERREGSLLPATKLPGGNYWLEGTDMIQHIYKALTL